MATVGSRTQRLGQAFGLALVFGFVASCGEDASAHSAQEAGDPPATEPPLPGPHGDPMGDALSQMIGPEGGALRSQDGRLSLTIPAGALSETTAIAVQEIEPTAPQHTGRSFRLSPAGLHFNVPVNLSFHYEDAEVAGSAPELLRIAYQDEAGLWHMYKQVELDKAAHTVQVSSDHFSDWSLVEGAVLLPLDGYVKIGDSLELQVMSCLKPLELGDGTVSITAGYECESVEELSAITYGWTVNGVIGGNEEVGTLRESLEPGRAIYTPPKQKPAQNPVAISVTARDYITELFGTQILISNIDVIDPNAKWSGTITYEVRGTHELEIPADFTGSETHSYSHKTVFTVTGVTERNGPRSELTFQQVSDVSHEKDGSRRKEVHEICQAGGPVILRHLFEYSIASWEVGHFEGSVPGDVYIGDDGVYNIGVDAAYIPVNGQDVIVDKYTHFCDGSVNDSSGTKALHTSEAVGVTYFEGTVSPENPNLLSGSFEKTLGDEYASKLRVSWDLMRASD